MTRPTVADVLHFYKLRGWPVGTQNGKGHSLRLKRLTALPYGVNDVKPR